MDGARNAADSVAPLSLAREGELLCPPYRAACSCFCRWHWHPLRHSWGSALATCSMFLHFLGIACFDTAPYLTLAAGS